MATFVSVEAVRDYLSVTGTSGQWSTGLIGSNINAASGFLQRRTGRQFEVASNTRSFSTWGRASLTIPDLRVAVGVTLNGVALVADESYYLIPDHNQSGVFTGIELPQNRYALSPGLNTFDINYNHLGSRRDTLPNDLVIDGGAGGWGHIPLPDELLQATKVLAAYYTIRPDALLSGAKQTPEGNTFDLSGLPPEVDEFIRNWKIAPDTVVSI